MSPPSGIPLAGFHLCKARHVCAFFNSADEQYAVTLPYIRDGLAHGDKGFHIVDPALRDQHVRRMNAFGIEAQRACGSGQLELYDWSETFFADGDFDVDRMLVQLEALLAGARQKGYPLTRFVAHAEWALDERAGLTQLLEFEAKVNLMWPEGSDAVICCYDLARFRGDTLIDVLRTHPMVIIGGILQENPFYVQPREFLEGLARASRSEARVPAKHQEGGVNDLQLLVNDLLGIVSLAAMWRGSDPRRIAQTLVDVLARLLRPDLLHVRIGPSHQAGDVQLDWSLQSRSGELGATLDAQLGQNPHDWPSSACVRFDGVILSALIVRLGLQGDGLLVVASQRPDFPTSAERLVLGATANQAAMGLQEARVLHAQREVAEELDRRVAQRTAELAAANADMRKEIARRIRTERRLRREEGELRRSRALLTQAQRLEALGTLAGGIAHDFNNILGAILGFGERALLEAPAHGRLRRDLEAIVAAGERGRALVDRVLLFSQGGSSERSLVHVESVVQEALDLLSATLPENITLETHLQAGRAAIEGDPTQLHRLLMNLATNAIQAMPGGGTLGVSLARLQIDAQSAMSIGTAAMGDYILLKVADSGEGIAPEIVDRVFDPFFTTRFGVGTGLGLSLVHRIVTEAGGAIDVTTVPGAGTTFAVYLPRTGDIADESRLQETPIPQGGGQSVLFVDDEEPLVRLATETLTEFGFAPVGFTSSAAALAAFRASPLAFDVVVTDERMPGLTGSALLRSVRAIRPSIPTLLVSGYIDGLSFDGGAGRDIDVVLKKPLSMRDLMLNLARVLGLQSQS